MSFLNRLFGRSQPQRTMYDEFLEVATPLLVNGYRRVAVERGCAPNRSISDAKIVEIYQKVGTAFQNAARVRGEILRAVIVNNIVLFFLQKYQMFGETNPAFFEQHISYEAAKYEKEGLRDEYNQELTLFDEPPLWHQQLPKELHYSDSALVAELEALRRQQDISHEIFFVALMQSRNMTYRSVHWAYLTAKRTMPGLSEREYLALAIIDRVTKKIMALPLNSSPTAHTAEQLNKILQEAESFADTCKNLAGVCNLAVQIENHEGTFDDPLGLISQIDGVFLNMQSAGRAHQPNLLNRSCRSIRLCLILMLVERLLIS